MQPSELRPGSVGTHPVDRTDRVLTVPNAVSMLRLAGVPLFLWLLLGPEADGLAMVVLAVSGATDWLDGKLARWLGQYSKLGAILDPTVDRLYTLAALAAFGIRDILPWWVIAVLVGRDVMLAACIPVLRHYGYAQLEVHYLGKAATLNLLYAFPLLLLAVNLGGTAAEIVRPLAYAFTAWGTALYLWSGVLYLVQVGTAVRAARAGAGGG